MATLRFRLIPLAALLAALAVSCAGAPDLQTEPVFVPDPYSSDSIRAAAGGLDLHAFTQGPEDADILVLVLHGWAASGAEGLVFGKALLEAAQAEISLARSRAGTDRVFTPSIRVVSPDLPGSGASDKPEAPYTPGWFAEIVEAFRQSLGRDRVVVAGHSLGGRLALEYALRYPEHTEALILLAPAALHESFLPWTAGPWVGNPSFGPAHGG